MVKHEARVFNVPMIRRYSKTIDGGTTWTTGAIDLGADGANLEINNIHGISATVAYAAVCPKTQTAVGGVWKTTDGGTVWIRQDAFNNAGSNPELAYFWNANNGVAVGDPVNGYFEIYTTSNGGANWTRTASSPAIMSIDQNESGLPNKFTVTGNTIWAGTTFGRILKSADHWVYVDCITISNPGFWRCDQWRWDG